MRLIACLLLVFFCFSPKAWNEAKGVSSRQFCRELLAEEQRPLSSDIQKILLQPFTYWRKGSQAYVFLSEDGNYVLKIPRLAKHGGSFLSSLFGKKREDRKILESFKIAALDLSEETATLYAQYAKTKAPFPCALYDLLGRRLEIPLDCVPFALQKRKCLLTDALTKENAKQFLIAWMDLVDSEKKKGYCATDHAFLLNISYDQGIAHRIDIGSYEPAQFFSWSQVAKPLRCYLREFDPSLLNWFEDEINKRVDSSL